MITRRTPITGNGWRRRPLFAGLESPSIAHMRFVASARVVAFDVSERDFPRNRSPPCWKFLCRPKENLRACLSPPDDAAWRAGFPGRGGWYGRAPDWDWASWPADRAACRRRAAP